MEKSEKIPLASGLIGLEASPIEGQLEVSLINSKDVNIVLRRKSYTGLPDVKFSIDGTALSDMLDILEEAEKKFNAHWLSRSAPAQLREERKTVQSRKSS